MAKQNPKKNMELLKTALAAWREYAPEATFGGVKLGDLQAAVDLSDENRSKITNKENELKGLFVKRDNDDLDGLKVRELLVNGVVGDPNFGPDSAFYESLGYIRKSDRKSGLTRRKKDDGKTVK